MKTKEQQLFDLREQYRLAKLEKEAAEYKLNTIKYHIEDFEKSTYRMMFQKQHNKINRYTNSLLNCYFVRGNYPVTLSVYHMKNQYSKFKNMVL